MGKDTINYPNDFPINSTTLEIYLAAYKNLAYYNLATDAKLLRDKQIIMLDEKGGQKNESLVNVIRASGTKSFDFQIWDTDHGFTNKTGIVNEFTAFVPCQIKQRTTKGFVQLGLDVEAIIGSAYPGFWFRRT